MSLEAGDETREWRPLLKEAFNATEASRRYILPHPYHCGLYTLDLLA